MFVSQSSSVCQFYAVTQLRQTFSQQSHAQSASFSSVISRSQSVHTTSMRERSSNRLSQGSSPITWTSMFGYLRLTMSLVEEAMLLSMLSRWEPSSNWEERKLRWQKLSFKDFKKLSPKFYRGKPKLPNLLCIRTGICIWQSSKDVVGSSKPHPHSANWTSFSHLRFPSWSSLTVTSSWSAPMINFQVLSLSMLVPFHLRRRYPQLTCSKFVSLWVLYFTRREHLATYQWT